MPYKKGNCIYIIGYEGMKLMFKIGKTKNMNSRIKPYITSNPHRANVLHLKYVENMTTVENILKITLNPYHHVGEGGKEWYKCDDVNILKHEIDSIISFLEDRISMHATSLVSNERKLDLLIGKGKIRICYRCDDLVNIINMSCDPKICQKCY
tara:strand:+ start:85 stop:543 length:459 start_codon:yes stop_codon:yes gene_type:complete